MTTSMFRILVIEDDAELRAMLCTLLESQAYRVSQAPSGQRGILEARNYRPDLVLVDLGLLGGYPWEAMLLAVRMELDGRITLRSDQSPSGRDFLDRLAGNWMAKYWESAA